MKTGIVFCSEHHGNTRKLLNAVAEHYDIDLIKADIALFPGSSLHTTLSDYDLIGFASGIYYQKFHKDVLKYAEDFLPKGKNVFFIYTCGIERKCYTDSIIQIAKSKSSKILGTYSCPGYDTFGPFKLVGGISKGRPNDDDIQNAIKFYEFILKKCSEK